MKTLKIGKVTLKNPLLLAPMVDVTDLAYRKICRDSGAALAYTEMIHVNAILHENHPTNDMMRKYRGEKPSAIQITGSNVDDFRKVLPYLKGYDIVDINCGCPSSRIMDNEAGAALLKTPEKIAQIIMLLKAEDLAVTAKIRLGYSKNNVIKIAKMIEAAGADALTVHARLASQGSSVPADWKWIKKVKQAVKIPVIGNGDISTGQDAKEMLKVCDGCMIARAAIGNPIVFDSILHYLKTGKEKKFDFKANLKLYEEYIQTAQRYDIANMHRIKYIGSKFMRNVEGASKMRDAIMKMKTCEEILEFIQNIKN